MIYFNFSAVLRLICTWVSAEFKLCIQHCCCDRSTSLTLSKGIENTTQSTETVFVLFFQEKMDSMFRKGEQPDSWIPVDVSFIKEFWLPDAEILNLKEFKTLDVLSKLEGLP